MPDETRDSAANSESNPSPGEAGGLPFPDRRRGSDRRSGDDRRHCVVDRRSGADRRKTPSLPDLYERRGPGIRRSENRRAAEEGEMTPEQWEFLQAIEEYKKVNDRPFPTWTEVLEVIKKLGYQKPA